MDLSVYNGLTPDDKREFREFLDMNAIVHEEIFSAMLEQGLLADHYPMFTEWATRDWMSVHAQEHVGIAQALGISGVPDLSNFDSDDTESMQNWMVSHALTHTQISQTLGLA